jgi:hypothetical protein
MSSSATISASLSDEVSEGKSGRGVIPMLTHIRRPSASRRVMSSHQKTVKPPRHKPGAIRTQIVKIESASANIRI